MHSFGAFYPRYEKFQVTDNLSLIREDVNGRHVRLYLPDHSGHLRLIFINDGDAEEYFFLDEAVLKKEFGVTYETLDIGDFVGYTRAENLDERNKWPATLYPDDTPRNRRSTEITPPQVNALCRLDEIIPATKTDAWL